MLTFEQVVEMLRREDAYSAGWGKGARKQSKVPGVPDHYVHALHPLEGQPYSAADTLIFAKKYWNEAELAMANFTPDGGAVRIRILKVASLLIRALMIHGRPSDVERLAGKSSKDFPILGGGLRTFDESTTGEGCLIPTPETRALRNESPGCNPLKKG